MKSSHTVALLLFTSLISIEAFASYDENEMSIFSMIPAALVGVSFIVAAYLLDKIGGRGLARVLRVIGLIIGGIAVLCIAWLILLSILSFLAFILNTAFTIALYIGLVLLACFIVYSVFNWLFTLKKRL